MMPTIGVIAANSKPEAHALAADVVPWLEAQGCRVVNETALIAGAPADVLVTFGGDGLIMRIAHLLPDVPILGINVGKVGFLARTQREDWRRALSRLIAGDYTVEESPTLTATLQRGGVEIEREWAINDVVIRSAMQMIEVELYIDQQFVNTYPGDGMIVATPQGSTAYGMAAGGPVLAAGVGGFAVVPICAHSPIRTTLVVPESALIELVVATERSSRVILDGVPQQPLEGGDVVQVQRGAHRFQLIVLEGMNFYEAFRTKFNFMIRPGAVPTRGRTTDSGPR